MATRANQMEPETDAPHISTLSADEISVIAASAARRGMAETRKAGREPVFAKRERQADETPTAAE